MVLVAYMNKLYDETANLEERITQMLRTCWSLVYPVEATVPSNTKMLKPTYTSAVHIYSWGGGSHSLPFLRRITGVNGSIEVGVAVYCWS